MEAAANYDAGSQLHLCVELPIMSLYINQHHEAVGSWLVVHFDDFDRMPCIQKVSNKVPRFIVSKRHSGNAAKHATCIPLARKTQPARFASSAKDGQLMSKRFRVNRRHRVDPLESYDTNNDSKQLVYISYELFDGLHIGVGTIAPIGTGHDHGHTRDAGAADKTTAPECEIDADKAARSLSQIACRSKAK